MSERHLPDLFDVDWTGCLDVPDGVASGGLVFDPWCGGGCGGCWAGRGCCRGGCCREGGDGSACAGDGAPCLRALVTCSYEQKHY